MAEEKNPSELMKYVTMGLAAGVGLLLVWVINTTNTNTSAINDHSKDISGIQKDHISEVNRSSDVDANQELEIKENEIELRRQLGLIHKNDKTIGILVDRSNRAYDGNDISPTNFNK